MNIHQENFPCCKRKVILGAWLAASAILFIPANGMAQTILLQDGGSSASLNLTGANAGMNNWQVLNENQLQLQWFYYSVNGGTAQSIDGLGLVGYQGYADNVPGVTNELDVTYANSQLSVNVDYVLNGGGVGSGQADITESLAIDNLSNTSLNLNFYQYSNFRLLGENNNMVNIANNLQFVQQNSGATALQESIDAPPANFAEAANAGVTLNELTTTPGYNLNDNLTAGPGNVSWAFEWDPTLGAAGSGSSEFDINKDKQLSVAMVPEPSSISLISLGLGAVGFLRRRRLSS